MTNSTALLKRFNEKWKEEYQYSSCHAYHIKPIIDLANAQSADIAELVACLQEIATTAQQASMASPEQFCEWAYHHVTTFLERIGHDKI